MRALGRLLVLVGASVAAVGGATPASAAEVTRVASSFEEDNRFDIHLGLAYSFNYKSAAILREWNSGAPGDDENRLVKDLVYRQKRHLLTPSAALSRRQLAYGTEQEGAAALHQRLLWLARLS